MTMHTDLAIIGHRSRQTRVGKLPTVESVDLGREVIGVAIVRSVFREIGLNKARAILRKQPHLKLAGNFFRSIVHQHEFAAAGDRRLRLLAEALGVDPNLEIAAAYADPDSYYSAAKRHGIAVPDFVRRRLEARRESIGVLLESLQRRSGIREELARENYAEAMRKIREEVSRRQGRRRRESYDHPSLFDSAEAA